MVPWKAADTAGEEFRPIPGSAWAVGANWPPTGMPCGWRERILVVLSDACLGGVPVVEAHRADPPAGFAPGVLQEPPGFGFGAGRDVGDLRAGGEDAEFEFVEVIAVDLNGGTAAGPKVQDDAGFGVGSGGELAADGNALRLTCCRCGHAF
jgi:hypothetical protein